LGGGAPSRSIRQRLGAWLATPEILSLIEEVYAVHVSEFMATPRRSLDMRTPREAMIHGDLNAVRQVLVNALEGHWA
jgi:hypothetical protein